MLSKGQMEGMTTNERLFEAGLMESFDKAMADGDVIKVREILKSVFVDDASIDLIVSSLHRNS